MARQKGKDTKELMTTVKIFVDNKEIQAPAGASLLEVCLENGIYIPNLCYIPGLERPRAACRLCFVAVEGVARPVTSCTVKVSKDLRVSTDTDEVRRLQRAGLKLLLSVHDVDCGHCPSNKKCPLQEMAKFLKVGLKPKNLDLILKTPAVVQDHPRLDYYPNRCVLCGKCLHACSTVQGHPLLTFSKRGFETIISFFGETERPELSCEGEAACAAVCPVSAIQVRPAEDS